LSSNLKFFGFGTVPNGTSRRAFFTDGEEVYVLGEGEVLLNRYRVLRIRNANLEFEEISSGRTGTAPLVEEQAGEIVRIARGRPRSHKMSALSARERRSQRQI
jgi:hypothetical protein